MSTQEIPSTHNLSKKENLLLGGKSAPHGGHRMGLLKGQAPGLARSGGRFLWHFLQMLGAMMVGMGIYMAFAGKSSDANRILWYAGMEFSMVPPMAALMLFQRHGWRSCLEMAGAMLIGPALILACAQLGAHIYIPGLSLTTLLRLADPLMVLGMLGAMLYRRELYTRPHAGHRHTEPAVK